MPGDPVTDPVPRPPLSNALLPADVLGQFIEGLPVAVFVIDAEGKPFYANDAAKTLLGKGIIEVAGTSELAETYGAFVAGTAERYPTERLPIVRALGGERSVVDDMEIRRPDRAVRIQVTGTPIFDANGDVAYAVAVFEEITERKATEEATAHALEVERLAAEQLRAADDLKNTFLHAVSHELRNPLATVQALGVALENGVGGSLSEDRLRFLASKIAKNTRKATRLLEDLLDLERLTKGLIEPDRRPTRVADIVRRVVEDSELQGERTIRLHLEDVVANVDPVQVERIVENLLGNAERHTRAGTAVDIRVEARNGGVVIGVDDAGDGVPEEMREAIFEPFRQAGGGTRRGGLGIGLSLVAKFAEHHGGRAWVESSADGGAAFRVFLAGA